MYIYMCMMYIHVHQESMIKRGTVLSCALDVHVYALQMYQGHVISPLSMSTLQLVHSRNVITHSHHITIVNATTLHLMAYTYTCTCKMCKHVKCSCR